MQCEISLSRGLPPQRLKKWWLVFVSVALVLGCAAPQGAAPTPTAAAVATQPATTEPTATPVQPEPATDWANYASLEGDYIVLGNPAAAVRVIDYSDFL